MHPQFIEASITIGLAGTLALYTLLFGRRGRSQRLFVALLASIIVWSGGVAVSRLTTDPVVASWGVQASFVGIFSLPPIWFTLALHLTNAPGFRMDRRWALLLPIPSLLAALAMGTNHWHSLFMREPLLISQTGPQEWAGPLFWVWVAWSYALVLSACGRYVGWSWRLLNTDACCRGALVFGAAVLPLSGNVMHLLDLVPSRHDPTPFLLGGATVMLFIANWRFRLLNNLPVARRDVIDHLRDGVLVADERGRILDMNSAAEEIMDVRRADLLGMPIVRAVATQTVDCCDIDEAAFNRQIIEMCSAPGGFESHLESFAGQHFEVRGSSVADSVGQISGLYIIVRDVTERTRFEELQRESRRAQAVASLAAGIAHEVNNPLSYIRANVSHVADQLANASDEKPADPGEMNSVLCEALEGIDRIGSIVERVRRFTHTRGGRRETISIPELLAEAARLPARTAGGSSRVVVDVEGEVPPVIGIRDGLLEAVLNLLDNARQATAASKDGSIRLVARRLGNATRIEIEDDGPGVPEDLRDRIFEPFVTTRLDDVGAGLGLAISSKLVADFGGTLAHEPASGRGTRFVIELPDTVLAPVAPASQG